MQRLQSQRYGKRKTWGWRRWRRQQWQWRQKPADLQSIPTSTRCTYPFNQNGKLDTIIAFEFVKYYYYYYYFGSGETQGAKCVHELTCSGCRDCCIKLVPSVKLGKRSEHENGKIWERKKKLFNSRTHGPSATHRYRQPTHLCHIQPRARRHTKRKVPGEPWTASYCHLNATTRTPTERTNWRWEKKKRVAACVCHFSSNICIQITAQFFSFCLVVNLAITYTDLIYHQIKGIKCDHFNLEFKPKKETEWIRNGNVERMLSRGHFRLEINFFFSLLPPPPPPLLLCTFNKCCCFFPFVPQNS